MKKLIACFLSCLLAFGGIFALADQGVSLFTPWYGTTVNVPGVYVTLQNTGGALYTGPGTEYYCISPFDASNVSTHCLSLAYDQYGATWVLVEVPSYDMLWRGYVRLSSFSASNQTFLTSNLPYESSYDALTPMMIAQLYDPCDGFLGPGESYPMLFPLEAAWTEGTLILTSGNWVLMELNDVTMQNIGVEGVKCRLWVKLGNTFY